MPLETLRRGWLRSSGWTAARPFAAALCLIAWLPWLAAFASAAEDVSLDTTVIRSDAVTVGRSWSGNYLAARHAHSRHDYPSAADYLLSASEVAPDDINLLRRVHFALVMDGRM